MNRRLAMCFLLLFAGFALSTRAQDIQVNRENKTVAVSVTKSVEVQPELGSVQIGYRNQGRLQSSVYEENGRQAQKIIEALLAAGVKKEDIQTEALQLGRVDEPSRESQQEKAPRFEAAQTWKIRVPIGGVQKVVDQAVAAGANDVSDVVWSVADPDALDVKARGEAISKARQIADEMAKSLGGRVGGLLYGIQWRTFRLVFSSRRRLRERKLTNGRSERNQTANFESLSAESAARSDHLCCVRSGMIRNGNGAEASSY